GDGRSRGGAGGGGGGGLLSAAHAHRPRMPGGQASLLYTIRHSFAFVNRIGCASQRFTMPRFVALSVLVVLLCLPWLIGRDASTSPKVDEIVGEVRDDNGPVHGAVVRIKAHQESVVSDENGRFRLQSPGNGARVTASKEGYFIASAEANASPLIIRLRKLA